MPAINRGLRSDSPFKDLVILNKHKEKLTIRIRPNGSIEVVIWKLREKTFSWSQAEWQQEQWLESNDSSELKRLQCFVIFHQFLGEVCNEIVKQLKQNLKYIERVDKPCKI